MYTQTEWMLFFFIYSILGWIWETVYVSPREKKFVNRGFLHGPWLPIYGFAAIIIIIITQPVISSSLLVFLCGVIGGTALEYFAGALIERLFNVRYWDYSGRPFNFRGYIWLPYSIAWGVLAILFVKYIQPAVVVAVGFIPQGVGQNITYILLVLFSADTTVSIHAAYDMKKLLETITKSNAKLRELEAIVKETLEDFSKTSSIRRAELSLRLKYIEDTLEKNIREYKINKRAAAKKRRFAIINGIRSFRNFQQNIIFVLEKKLDAAEITARLQLNDVDGRVEKSVIKYKLNKMLELHKRVESAKRDILAKQEKDYRHALDIIHRNNVSVSERFEKAFEQLKEIIEE